MRVSFCCVRFSFSVFSQEIGGEECIRNDLSCGPAHVGQWSKHSGAMCSRVTRSVAEVETFAWVHLPANELFGIIVPMQVMNREVIPGRKKRVRRCPL